MAEPRKFEELGKEPREVEDADIADMIDFYQTSGMGRFVVYNTVAMLQELLRLREKARKDA